MRANHASNRHAYPRWKTIGSNRLRCWSSRWTATVSIRRCWFSNGGTFDNSYLFDEASKRGNRFKVAVLVDPDSDDPIGDLERLTEQGASGIRLAPDAEFVNAGPYDMWKKTGELGLVVTCQGDPARFASDAFARVLDACPDTHVVIEHLAGIAAADAPWEEDYEKALVLAERDNTTIKIPGFRRGM